MFGIPSYLKHFERTRPARIGDDAGQDDRRILGARLLDAEGATLVEMALSASVLFVILFGIIEVCMGLYSYNLVSEAARQATRYAAVRGTNSCTYATKTFPDCNLNPTTAGNAIQTYVRGLGFPYSSQMNATATWWTAVQDVNGRMLLRQIVRDLPGAVGRVVVHDQYVHRNGESQNALGQRGEIAPLVISRHDDERTIHAASISRQRDRRGEAETQVEILTRDASFGGLFRPSAARGARK